MTGSYGNTFHIYDRDGKSDIQLRADRSAFKAKRVGPLKAALPRNSNNNNRSLLDDSTEFSKKILHASWHPRENTIAVAATNNLYIFT